jgi:predicted AAA+ superfamily ATPase
MVYDYLKELENAFISAPLLVIRYLGKGILKTQEKFYVSDPAMRYSVLGYTPDSVAAVLEMWCI